MAKKKEEEVTGTNAVTVIPGSSNQLPDYLRAKSGPTGAENIQTEDVTIPRLKIGQDMNPEVQEGSVERGDLFLNVTGEVVAPAGGKLPFIVLASGKEYILWRPKKDNGGGILARAKPVVVDGVTRYKWDKPNESFEVKVEGVQKVTWTTKEYIDEDGLGEWGSEIPGDSSSKKAATDHHNYVVLLPTYGEMVTALSLSRTATGKAKDFNAMLKMGSAPLPGRIYTVETVDDKRDSHAFKNYKFRPAGFVTNEADFLRYERLAASFKGRSINVDHSDGDSEAEADERA